MERETAKRIMWNEHAARWEPPEHHQGPWNPWKDARPLKARARLVWAEVTRGNDTRTYCDCDWADKQKGR